MWNRKKKLIFDLNLNTFLISMQTSSFLADRSFTGKEIIVFPVVINFHSTPNKVQDKKTCISVTRDKRWVRMYIGIRFVINFQSKTTFWALNWHGRASLGGIEGLFGRDKYLQPKFLCQVLLFKAIRHSLLTSVGIYRTRARKLVNSNACKRSLQSTVFFVLEWWWWLLNSVQILEQNGWGWAERGGSCKW